MIALPETLDTVAATLTAAEAAAARWQAVVVGAGPAGAATAWRLAEAGIRVLLVDRHTFPRGKVCGCCLSRRALDELHALGAHGLKDDAVMLETVRLVHRGRSVGLPLPAGGVMSRARLDATLVRQAIAAGCHWLPATHVQSIDDETGGRGTVTLLIGERMAPAALEAEMLVIATGLADHVRISGAAEDARRIDRGSRIGAGCVLPAAACALPVGELVMAVGRDGYCGLVRLEDGRIDVAAALDRAAVARDADPARTVASVLVEAVGQGSRLVPDADAIRAAAVRATPPLTRRAPLVVGGSRRILRVGDAAGYVEPFTGEGIGWALTSARILVAAAVAPHGVRSPIDMADRYLAAHRREFSAVHARCRRVSFSLRWPAVVATTVAAARTVPWAARRIMPMVIGATRSGDGR